MQSCFLETFKGGALGISAVLCCMGGAGAPKGTELSAGHPIPWSPTLQVLHSEAEDHWWEQQLPQQRLHI